MNIPLSALRFAIRTDQPYRMHHHCVILPDDSVAWTDHKSIDSYAAEHGGTFKILTGEELDAVMAEAEAALVTKPAPITAERFDDYLECLPPCRWHRHAGVELFHVSERLTGDLVQWCARIEGQCYGWTDQARRPSDELAAAVAEAHRIHTGPGAN
jgi:hypothetical protein